MHLIHCAVEKRNVPRHLLNTVVFLHVYICCWLLLVCHTESRVQLPACAAINKMSVNPNCKQCFLWWGIVRHQFNLRNTHIHKHMYTHIHPQTYTYTTQTYTHIQICTHRHTHAHNQQSQACQATNFILGLTMFVHTSYTYRHGLLLTQVDKIWLYPHHIHTLTVTPVHFLFKQQLQKWDHRKLNTRSF